MDIWTDQHRNLMEQDSSGPVLCPGVSASFWGQTSNFEQEKGGS